MRGPSSQIAPMWEYRRLPLGFLRRKVPGGVPRKALPRSAVPIIAVCLTLVVACAPDPELPKVPLRLDFPGPDPGCELVEPPTVGPEVWERDEFRNRIANGRVEKPIAVNCVVQAYPGSELERYADLGDPVAALAWTMQSYSGRGDDACKDISSIRVRLTNAYRIPNTVVPGPRSRVPEAAFVLALLENYCAPGGDGFNRLNLLAYDLGYDLAAARPPLIE